MGYILPYVPAESIQAHNRVNFERWRAIYPVQRPSKAKNFKERGQSAAADVIGKGRNVDEKA